MLIKTLPDGAPKNEIIIDDLSKFYTDVIFTPTNSAFQKQQQSNMLGFIYKGTTPSSGIIPGGFTLRWNKIATDVYGNEIDMELELFNFHGMGETNPMVLGILTNGQISARANWWDTNNKTHNQFNLRWHFYKHDTQEETDATWTMRFDDIDTRPMKGWYESVILTSNYNNNIYIVPDDYIAPNSLMPSKPGCWLSFGSLERGIIATPYDDSPEDDGTLHSGFAIAASSGFTMEWYGYGCGSIINKIYGNSIITASNDSGGEITCPGTTSIAWKNDKTYTATSDNHHIISRIIVDGKDIPVTNPKEQSYTFQEVTSNHTIHVSFTNIQHALIYDANTSSDDDYTGETPSTIHDAGTNASISENGFARQGYRFVSWNEKSDGSGKAYAPGDEIFIDDEDITFYALWERLVSVTFQDEDGTIYTIDDNVPIGGSSTPTIVPTRTGYTFAGWTGTYTDVQKDEVVIASWTPNKYTVIYEPNGGEGEHMPVQQMRYDEDETISESSYIRHNYEFIGWNTQPDGTGTSYTPGKNFKNLTEEPDGKVHLYAQWEFYIQMPDTGENGGEVLAITGLGMVSVAFASVMISRRQRRRADGAETSQRRTASAALWDSCKNHIEPH